MKLQYKEAAKAIEAANKIVVIQAENPDGDSMASAAAIESMFSKKDIVLFCVSNMPPYLKYVEGWDRVTSEMPNDADLFIIVDTSSRQLLDKTMELPESKKMYDKPVIVIDHHSTEDTIDFDHISLIDEEGASTSEVIYNFAKDQNIYIDLPTAEHIVESLMADSRRLSNDAVSVSSLEMLTELVKLGVDLHKLESNRQLHNKKSQRITAYKGRLLERIEYSLDGRLAVQHIPWEEIEEYSHEYNPSILVIHEMLQVEGVEVALSFKTYPDGKITCMIRSSRNAPISARLAEHFGAGGHPCAAGLKTHDKDFSELKTEVIKKVDELLQELTNEAI